jgi:hypothetical protein
MRNGGKGDLRRPLTVSEEKFNESWDLIFNKSKVKESLEDSIKENAELYQQLSEHEKECGK